MTKDNNAPGGLQVEPLEPFCRAGWIARMLTVALMAFLGWLAITPASAQEAGGSVVVVFDSSGSMWGNVPGGPPKFEAAHSALTKAFPAADAKIRTGLMIFGPGCSRVDVAATPAIRSGAETLAALGSLNPKSKGPIADALQQSLAMFEPGQPGSIVLVADGPDNCRGDPCSVAADIAQSRPELKIHTIGLGMDQPDPTLACVSQATDGRFFTAGTMQDLDAAATQALDLAMNDMRLPKKKELSQKTKPGKIARPQYDPDGPPQLVLSAALGKSAKKDEQLDKPVRWRVYQTDSEPATEAVPMLDVLEPSFAVPLATGSYWVDASLGRARLGGRVDIGEKGPTFFKANFDAGLLKVNLDGGATGGHQEVPAIVTVEKPGKGGDGGAEAPVVISPYRSSELVLPVGQYEVRAESGPIVVSKAVTIQSGKTADLDLRLHTGQLSLVAQTGLGAAAAKQLQYTVSVDDPDSPGGRRIVARSAAERPVFELPAGTYYTEAKVGFAQANNRVALGSGKSLSQALTVEAARIRVKANIPPDQRRRPRPVVYKLYTLEPLAVLARSSGKAPEFVVAPGRYRVVADIGSRNVRSVQDVLVAAGDDADITLTVAAGDVKLRVSDKDGKPLTGQFWEVVDDSGAPVWRTQRLVPHALLAPGRYRVRCETRSGLVQGEFNVAAGDAKTVELRVQ